jgi:hypothetical protein
MATALRKFREQIARAVVNDRPYLAETQRLQQGLTRKVQKLVSKKVERQITPLLKADAETFANYYLDNKIVQLLLLPTADLRFFLARHFKLTMRNVLYASPDGCGVECYRDATTLLINAEGKEGATQSWSRCLSVSMIIGKNVYSKHLYERNYRGPNAKYAATVIPRNVEALVVRCGSGHFESATRLFMYGRFAFTVGQTGRYAARTETQILKVQLDRTRRPAFRRRVKSGARRPRQDGWEVRMHGYPITENELFREFPAGARQVIANEIHL